MITVGFLECVHRTLRAALLFQPAEETHFTSGIQTPERLGYLKKFLFYATDICCSYLSYAQAIGHIITLTNLQLHILLASQLMEAKLLLGMNGRSVLFL
jgi:hypothetical protein